MQYLEVHNCISKSFAAALEAVNPSNLIQRRIRQDKDILHIAGQRFNWRQCPSILVIGAGKASAAMAQGFELGISACADGDAILERVSGLVNVIDGTQVKTSYVELFPARPQGENSVTPRVLSGTERMLSMMRACSSKDIVVDLISGGGSALREKWVDGVTTKSFNAAQRLLERADISSLNAVRKLCSRVKGGNLNCELIESCHVIALILSDVLGDPIDVIASGPWARNTSSPENALDILLELGGQKYAPEIVEHLQNLQTGSWNPPTPGKNVTQEIVGSNKIALKEMERSLENQGFHVISHGSENSGYARDFGHLLADYAEKERALHTEGSQAVAHIFGGETIVDLRSGVEDRVGGGRNQRIVLSALEKVWSSELKNVLFFSLGTDGEDGRGPRPVAGAIAGEAIISKAKEKGLSPEYYLERCDEFPFFDSTGGHFESGLSGTNVCDLSGFAIW